MSRDCQITNQREQPVLLIRTRTNEAELPKVIGEGYGRLMAHIQATGQQMAGAPYVAYHNMDMQDLDLEMGMPIAQPGPGAEDIQSGCIPAGQAVSCLHVGPYPALGETYQAISDFVAHHNLQPTGVAYEFYLNDPETTAPDELETMVIFPLLSNG